MLPVFLYWFYLQITGGTTFKKGMAFTNVLVIFLALKMVATAIPESAFRLGFTNGLMSESMLVWFLLIFLGVGQTCIPEKKQMHKEAGENDNVHQ